MLSSVFYVSCFPFCELAVDENRFNVNFSQNNLCVRLTQLSCRFLFWERFQLLPPHFMYKYLFSLGKTQLNEATRFTSNGVFFSKQTRTNRFRKITQSLLFCLRNGIGLWDVQTHKTIRWSEWFIISRINDSPCDRPSPVMSLCPRTSPSQPKKFRHFNR